MGKNFLKTFFVVLLLIAIFALQGCSSTNTASNDKTEQTQEANTKSDATIAGEDFDENSGADAYANAGDNAESKFYKNPDFYNLKNDDTLVIIENFKTMQQTTEWSCGNVTALMVLENLNVNNDLLTEMSIAESMNSHTDLDVTGSKPGSANNFGEYGTDVEQMYNFFKRTKGVKIVETSYKENYTDKDLYTAEDEVTGADIGNLKRTFSGSSLYASENSDETDKWVTDAKDSYFVKWLTGHLKENRAVMVEWVDWNGHWQAIIGYDNNGTPSIGDDTLIFADPYDTSDHSQDGYYVYPLERWFFMWHDRSIAPKPFQLQPYIIVDKAE